jgi:aspartyl-tRNA synthetase
MKKGNIYRTYNSSQIGEKNIGENILIGGWIDTIRDHGGISFIDVRDHYGTVQVVVENKEIVDTLKKEQCISAEGIIRLRDISTVNPKINTGTVELLASSVTILGDITSPLPFDISGSKDIREDLRLKYRFLDLRNPDVHNKIILRSEVVNYIRQEMRKMGFLEITTPILTASSPEGARDYLVPSRKHKGCFYALPQAPQIFKQLLMVSGFDKYFQIAPCFRDEDARADRAPGEFYQLDFEMSFATQEDVFETDEKILYGVFSTFGKGKVSAPPFERITYSDSMLMFGSDKPDLRNPLRIIDLSEFFDKCDFAPFKNKCVRGIKVPNGASLSKGFHEKMLAYAMEIGMKGLGYVTVEEDNSFKGPIDKFIPSELKKTLSDIAGLKKGDLLFFIADTKDKAPLLAGQIRTELGTRLDIIEKDSFDLCFVTDFPMYEIDEESGNWAFKHNPFSMPQGGYEKLVNSNPGDILAYQYDIVCNGVELSSGAVRNHEIKTMEKAFEIAGYSREDLSNKFPSLYNAFRYGAPPHAGMAPGIDRILMLLSQESNIREVIAFPMNKNAQDLLMGAPSEVTEKQLREVHIKIRQ